MMPDPDPTTEPSVRPRRAPGRLPPLLLVRAFEATARTGSMRRAAADIGVSHTVIVRHVRHLEKWLGLPLVTAGPRGIRLTREGEVLFESVATAFEMIAATTDALRPQARRRMLRIWCMPGLATRWLMPRLGAIEALLPAVEISIRSIDRAPDFAAGEADLMIGFGDPGALPHGATPLIRPRLFPVAACRWLAGNPAPESPAALARAQLIHEESHQQWHDWLAAAGVVMAEPLRGPRLWDASLGLDAALAGQGIALASGLTAAGEIADGRLAELFRTEIRLGGYYLMVAPKLRRDRAIRHFGDWLAAELQASETAGGSGSGAPEDGTG